MPSVAIPATEFDRYIDNDTMSAAERQQRLFSLIQAYGIPMAGTFQNQSLALLGGIRYHYGLNKDATVVTIYWRRA